jgi:hypothetical protein
MLFALIHVIHRISYVKGIIKFCTRRYQKMRMPFDGMIGFVDYKPSDSEIKQKINSILDVRPIRTLNNLQRYMVESDFEHSYFSKHHKDFSNDSFGIYHLFFNYSSLIKE